MTAYEFGDVVLEPVVATLEQGLVLRRLGRLDERDQRSLRGVLGEILGP